MAPDDTAQAAESLEQKVVGVVKPLLRGWIHAGAAGLSVVLLAALLWRSWGSLPKLISMMIFGLSMIQLYTVSAIYHIGNWREKVRSALRAVDHSNIFLVIAGTYTPISVLVLEGAASTILLAVIWTLALAGIALAVLGSGVTRVRLEVPRWVRSGLYIAMGWIAIFAAPALLAVLPWSALAMLLLGGALYTIGAVIYARRRPNPFPRVLGFHEVFHIFVVAGGAAFALFIWIWVLPIEGV